MSSSVSVNAAVAGRLVQARQSTGLDSPHAAAIRLGMHPQTYSIHEKGKSGVKPAELRRYAEAFGVSHGWLSTGIEAEQHQHSNNRLLL